MILLLHTLVEATVGLLFLFYPNAGDLVPGFGGTEGESFTLVLKMYGLAALFLAGLSLYTYLRREVNEIFLFITLGLGLFHFGMTLVQALYNYDHRATLLHFLLAIFLSGQYVQRRRTQWTTPA